MKKLFLSLLIMALLGAHSVARGQEEGPGDAGAAAGGQGTAQEQTNSDEGAYEDMAELPPLHYVLEPEMDTWLGFRYASVFGSKKVMEYGWPFSSAAGGFKLNYSPLPQRLDAELDWSNLYDYEAEFSYAYKDIFKLNYIGSALWHNLDHFVPQPANTEYNPGAGYHVAVNDNRLGLRLKWPDRAYHVFSEFRSLEREGTIQQRFNATVGKASRSRDIDWMTRQYKAGLNGHFGPVEVEYYHRIKTFDPHGDVALKDQFTLDRKKVFSLHNVVPTLETNEDTVKAHTDLTGRIVGSATFTNGRKDNNSSGAKADFRRAYSDITLIPLKDVTVAVRYRYKEMRVENPDTVFDNTVPSRPAASRFQATQDSIENTTNRAEVAVRYSPLRQLAVKAEYGFINTRRFNSKLWDGALAFQNIPMDQNEQTVKLGVDARPLKGVNFRGMLGYAYTSEPAYSIRPQNSFTGRFDTDLGVIRDLNADVYYRFAREANNSANLEGSRDNAGASVVWTPLERVSVSAGYDYFRVRTERDLQLLAGSFSNGLGGAVNGEPELPLDHVAYNDTSHLYYIGAGYRLSIPLSFDAEFHQSWSRGGFRTGVSEAFGKPFNYGTVNSAGVGELTDMRIRETGGKVSARYDLPKGWGVSANYSINNYEDMRDKPQDGPQDGTAHVMLVMVSKKW